MEKDRKIILNVTMGRNQQQYLAIFVRTGWPLQTHK
jgi:hypothetical protein